MFIILLLNYFQYESYQRHFIVKFTIGTQGVLERQKSISVSLFQSNWLASEEAKNV